MNFIKKCMPWSTHKSSWLRKSLFIMRCILLFLLLGTMQITASVTYSQSAKLSLNIENRTVGDVLSMIEQESSFYFTYNVNQVNVNRKVSVNVKNKLVTDILDEIFKGENIRYTISDKHIVLYKADKSELLVLNQKLKTITGVVLDNNDEPIIGANVSISGTSTGTITDVDGKFTLEVPDNAQLQFSFIGYISQVVPVGNKTVFNIRLLEDTQKLDEVVVVGYGTQKKVNLTGSITAIKTSELENIPVSNLSNALAGRAPGVTITNNSGFAGASSSIRIRGSFGEPLYVINGIIRDKTAFDALDPNEVESINILKDAASASIYGSKAGNGVVLVTTKKGTAQKPVFQYKASYTTANTTRPLQDWTSYDELDFLNKVAVYQNSNSANPDLNFQHPYGDSYYEYFKDKDGYNVNDLIWQNPWNQEHNVSVNGGNERITYYMMLGYHGEEGSYKNTDYNRYNFRSDITTKITDAFKVNFNISGNERDYKRFYWPYDWDPESMTLSDFYRTTFNQSRLRPE